MKLEPITGDLIQFAKEGRYQAIVHGCNCFCNMGAGIAKQIKHEFPNAYLADTYTKLGDKKKLGSYSAYDSNGLIVINAYTQYRYSRTQMQANYKAIRSVFNKININFKGLLIGYPKIGSGLAGGDWNVISRIIDDELIDCDHQLVVFGKR